MTCTVLHVLEALEGGTARHLVDICRHTPDVDHVVVIPSHRSHGVTDRDAEPRMRASGAAVHHVDMRRTPWSPVNLRAVRRVRELAGEVGPDVVHAHSSIGGLVARLATVGTDVPVVYTPNGLTDVRAGRAVERLLARLRTDLVVAVSPSEAAELSLGRIVGSQGVEVVPNGVDPQSEPTPGALRARLGLDPGVPLVGTVARLVAQKAPEVYVAAMADVLRARTDAHAVLIGDGDRRRAVTRAVEQMGDARARFHHLPHVPDAGSALGDLDVFVLTSRFEGLPYTALEAMLAGTPVVLTDVVGNRDVVEHGVSGLLVPAGDPAATAESVLALLADPQVASRLAEGGFRRVRSGFDVRTSGRRLGLLYHRIAAGSA